MKKLTINIALVYMLCCGFVLLNAQAYDYFETELSENKHMLGFELGQRFETDALTSGFVLDFINGKFITNEDKDACIGNFKNHEILTGEQIQTNLSYSRRLIGGKNRLYLATGEVFFYEARMHEDLFILIFKGNKNFENKSASLQPFNIRSLQYFFLKGGFHRITDRYSLKLNAAYIGGQRFLELNTTQGYLFTESTGKSIDLDLKLSSHDAISNRSFFDFTGNGIMTDALLDISLSKNIIFGGGITGYGFIDWSQDVTKRSVDTIHHFEGAEINNILDSFSIAVKNVEELKSSFIRNEKLKTYSTKLPFVAYLRYSQFILPSFLQFEVKYGIIKSDIANDFLNSSVNLYLSSSKLIGMNIDIGGYGTWNLGAQYATRIKNSSSLHIYFNSINNLISPGREFNLTGGLKYRKCF